MLRVTSILLLIVVLIQTSWAQPPRPPHPRDERRWLADLRGRLPRHESERRNREWARIWESLTPDEKEVFDLLAPEEKREWIEKLAARHRQADEALLLDTLPTEEREAINKLDAPARAQRLLELRLARQREIVITDGKRLGILSEDEADSVRTLPLLRQAERILELQQKVFLSLHAEPFARFPEALREHLLSLPPREFFEEGALRDLRAQRLITRQGARELRRRGPTEIERVLKAIEEGRLSPDDLALLDREALGELSRLEQPQRARRIAEIRRTRFFREIEQPGLAPGPPRERRGLMPPPHIFRSLEPWEQDFFLNLTNTQRRQLLESRFPDLELERAGPPGRPEHHTLGEVLERVRDLPPPERDRLLRMPVPRALQELFPTRPRRPRR